MDVVAKRLNSRCGCSYYVPMAPGADPEYKTLRLIDLKAYEVVAVRCKCGRIVHYPNGYLQRHAKLSSLTLIYDLQFRLRCAHCNSRDGFQISVEDHRHIGDNSKPILRRVIVGGRD